MCLKAVAGHSPEGVQRLREDFPAEVAVYPSAEDLIESGSCDAVLIAAPHREHPRLAMEAFAMDCMSCVKNLRVWTRSRCGP